MFLVPRTSAQPRGSLNLLAKPFMNFPIQFLVLYRTVPMSMTALAQTHFDPNLGAGFVSATLILAITRGVVLPVGQKTTSHRVASIYWLLVLLAPTISKLFTHLCLAFRAENLAVKLELLQQEIIGRWVLYIESGD